MLYHRRKYKKENKLLFGMVFSDQLLQACGQEFRDRVPHSFDFKKRFYVCAIYRRDISGRIYLAYLMTQPCMHFRKEYWVVVLYNTSVLIKAAIFTAGSNNNSKNGVNRKKFASQNWKSYYVLNLRRQSPRDFAQLPHLLLSITDGLFLRWYISTNYYWQQDGSSN